LLTDTLQVEALIKATPALMAISDALRIKEACFSSQLSMIVFSSTLAAWQNLLALFDQLKTHLRVTGN
jgi:hypothetical protein